MVRFRFIRQVRYGHFPQALDAANEMSARQKVLGGPEGTHWIGVAGPVNTLITEMEFSSLAALEAYMRKSDGDAEHIKLRQKAGEHNLEGSTYIEILQTAPQLARE